MKILETSKFARLRRKLVDRGEIEALKAAIVAAPGSGKKLHGEFAELRTYPFTANGQSRRLIYRWNDREIVLFSFGPRQGIYKKNRK